MLVPTRMRVVTAASWASVVSASSPHDSPALISCSRAARRAPRFAQLAPATCPATVRLMMPTSGTGASASTSHRASLADARGDAAAALRSARPGRPAASRRWQTTMVSLEQLPLGVAAAHPVDVRVDRLEMRERPA